MASADCPRWETWGCYLTPVQAPFLYLSTNISSPATPAPALPAPAKPIPGQLLLLPHAHSTESFLTSPVELPLGNCHWPMTPLIAWLPLKLARPPPASCAYPAALLCTVYLALLQWMGLLEGENCWVLILTGTSCTALPSEALTRFFLKEWMTEKLIPEQRAPERFSMCACVVLQNISEKKFPNWGFWEALLCSSWQKIKNRRLLPGSLSVCHIYLVSFVNTE